MLKPLITTAFRAAAVLILAWLTDRLASREAEQNEAELRGFLSGADSAR